MSLAIGALNQPPLNIDDIVRRKFKQFSCYPLTAVYYCRPVYSKLDSLMNTNEPLFIGIPLILSEDQLVDESKKPTPSCFILQPLLTTYSPTNYHVE